MKYLLISILTALSLTACQSNSKPDRDIAFFASAQEKMNALATQIEVSSIKITENPDIRCHGHTSTIVKQLRKNKTELQGVLKKNNITSIKILCDVTHEYKGLGYVVFKNTCSAKDWSGEISDYKAYGCKSRRDPKIVTGRGASLKRITTEFGSHKTYTIENSSHGRTLVIRHGQILDKAKYFSFSLHYAAYGSEKWPSFDKDYERITKVNDQSILPELLIPKDINWTKTGQHNVFTTNRWMATDLLLHNSLYPSSEALSFEQLKSALRQ